jgi:mannose-6-phosphate isomerase-like protein (cupin superfamily)
MSTPVNLPIPPLGHGSVAPDVTAPDGSEIRLLVDQRHAAVGASVVEVTLPAGQVSKPVFHRTVEEVWYILQGSGQVWRCPPGVAEPSLVPALPVKPGDALVIPTGWLFQFSADESGTLHFLCFTMPPWPGDDEAQPAGAGGLGQPTV